MADRTSRHQRLCRQIPTRILPTTASMSHSQPVRIGFRAPRWSLQLSRSRALRTSRCLIPRLQCCVNKHPHPLPSPPRMPSTVYLSSSIIIHPGHHMPPFRRCPPRDRRLVTVGPPSLLSQACRVLQLWPQPHHSSAAKKVPFLPKPSPILRDWRVRAAITRYPP